MKQQEININDSLVQNQEQMLPDFQQKKIGSIGPMLWIYGSDKRQLKQLCANTTWQTGDVQLKQQLQNILIELRNRLDLELQMQRKTWPAMITAIVFMLFIVVCQIVLGVFNQKRRDSLGWFEAICALVVLVCQFIVMIYYFKNFIRCNQKLQGQIEKMNQSNNYLIKNHLKFKLNGEFYSTPDQQQFPNLYKCFQNRYMRLIFNQFNFVQVFHVQKAEQQKEKLILQ